MKKFISVFLILMLTMCCMLSGCSSNKEDYYVSLRLVDEVRDQYDNVLQRTYYNEDADEYLIKEYTYCLQKNKWVCVDQKTTIYKTTYDRPESPVDNSLTIYYNNDLTTGPLVILDNEYAKISIVKYLAKDDWYEFGYELKIVNKTNQVLTMSLEDFYIMDIMCKPLFSIDHVEAGKTAYFKMAWDKDALERSHIPYVDNIEFMVRIFDNENWTSTALAGNRIMIKN